MEIEKQEHNIYNERLKFLDAKKSCYKLVVGALKSDPNARYSTTVTKTEEKTGLVLEWNITCLNNDLKVTIEWIDNSLYNFKGKKEDVQFIINLIRFNFHSLLDIEEGHKEEMTLNLELEVDKVFKKLLEERNKTVILAVEEGSCAWGLDSVDSDHDIRFIYLSDISYYLSIERHKQRDALVFEEKNMDFSGWDFRKALQLCRESNPGLLDWLRSSKILIKENLLIDELLKLAIETHCTKSLFYHWLNTAEKHDKLFFGDKNQVILKKYFYVLRPLLCIEWKRLFFINNNRDNELPPMILKELVESISVEDKNCTLNENVKIEILKLIERKTKSNMGTGDRIKVLDEWIEKSWNFYGEYCKKLEKRKQDKKYLDLFDQFFQKTIRKYLLK